MKILSCIFLVFALVSCSSDDKAIDVVTENIERGAILRNVERISKDFIHNDLNSIYSIIIEEQDLEDGQLLDFVKVYLSYEDRNHENGDNSALENEVATIPKTEFQTGPFGLPRTNYQLSYQEAIEFLGLDSSLIFPGDQFKLRFEVNLTDGRTFSTQNGSASILTDFCFFKSPYRYEINVIDPLQESLFTGVYSFNIVSGISNEVDPNEGVLTIIESDLPNTRIIGFGFAEPLEVTFAGNKIYPKIYQSITGVCRESELNALSGPCPDTFGEFDNTDDSVFFLDLSIGFEGWTGGTGEERCIKYRFSKQ